MRILLLLLDISCRTVNQQYNSHTATLPSIEGNASDRPGSQRQVAEDRRCDMLTDNCHNTAALRHPCTPGRTPCAHLLLSPEDRSPPDIHHSSSINLVTYKRLSRAWYSSNNVTQVVLLENVNQVVIRGNCYKTTITMPQQYWLDDQQKWQSACKQLSLSIPNLTA